VAVEKLTHRKIVGKTLQQEALQTTISVVIDFLKTWNYTAVLAVNVFLSAVFCKVLSLPAPVRLFLDSSVDKC
jgi:hypothetical protein